MTIYETWLYNIFKILQFTGTFLLITNNLSLNRKDMIRNFADGSKLITKKNNKIVYDDSAFRDSYKKIVLNIISFVLILVSLTLDAFNIKVAEGDSPFLSSVLIIAAATLFSSLIRSFVNILVDKKKIPPITAKELKMLGINPDVEIITEKAIDKKIEDKAQELVDKNVHEIVNKEVNKKVEKKVEKIVEQKVEEKIEEVKASSGVEEKPKEFKLN